MGVPVSSFIAKCYEIEHTKPVYQLGGDGSDGTCDCIGLLIGAIKRSGGSWPGTHGSNYTARNEIRNLEPFDQSRLQVGMPVLKTRSSGLPDAYRHHPDQNNYYHIGVVVSVAPLDIMHCTTYDNVSGIVHDHKQGSWGYMGLLNRIDYGSITDIPNTNHNTEDLNMNTNATVSPANGKPTNFRRKPTTESSAYASLPAGTRVEVTGTVGEWSAVNYNGLNGYIMTKFIVMDGPETSAPVTDNQETPAPSYGSEVIEQMELQIANLQEQIDRLNAIPTEIISKISELHEEVSWG